MGRILHYQTEEGVNAQEFELLKKVAKKYNGPRRSSCKRIKLWRKSDILSCMRPRDALWGFTKVRDDAERELVFKAVKEMSLASPRLTWVLYEDNGSVRGKEITLKNGEIIETI
jgi:hypothetical protein